MTLYNTNPEGHAYPVLDIPYTEVTGRHAHVDVAYSEATSASASVTPPEAAAQIAVSAAAEAPTPVPHMLARLATALDLEPGSSYMQANLVKAQGGDLVDIPGISGHFAGNGQDRPRLDKHFREVGLTNGWRVVDTISAYDGPAITARAFHRADAQDAAFLAELFASGRSFAITGSHGEIVNGKLDNDPDQYRQIWIPQRDEHGRLPLYLRIVGPHMNARDRIRSLVSQDWVILPYLAIPDAADFAR